MNDFLKSTCQESIPFNDQSISWHFHFLNIVLISLKSLYRRCIWVNELNLIQVNALNKYSQKLNRRIPTSILISEMRTKFRNFSHFSFFFCSWFFFLSPIRNKFKRENSHFGYKNSKNPEHFTYKRQLHHQDGVIEYSCCPHDE